MGLAGLLGLLVSGCSTLDVKSDWDPEFAFGKLQTWRWAEHAQTKTGDTYVDTDGLLARRVERAVTQTLASRGYTETSTSQADFEVGWFLTVEPKTQVTTVNDYYGYGPGWGGWYGAGYPRGSSSTVVDSYNQGTLIIDISNAATGHLIWRGSASARLREKSDPEKAQKRVDEAVSQILARFPPPSS